MKSIWYVATPGLGEVISQTPVMRALYAEGKKVTLVARERMVEAFDDANFLHEVISCGEDDLQYNGRTILLGEKHVEKINRDNADVISPFVVKNTIQGTVFGLNNPYRAFVRRGHSPIDGYAGSCGVDPSGYEMYVSAGDSISLPGINVGICIGSFEVFRRIPLDTMKRIVSALEEEFTVYVFGQDFPGEDWSSGFANSVMNDTLKKSLGYMKAMDVFICPDTGFLHAAVALKIPTISIQSREASEHLIHPNYWRWIHHYAVNDALLNCKRECRAKFFEKNIGNDRRPSPRWNRSLVCYLPDGYPTSMACAESVDCLKLIDAYQLCQQVKEIIHEHRDYRWERNRFDIDFAT